MSYILPIFIEPGDSQEKKEFLEGVKFRFKQASSLEINRITPVIVENDFSNPLDIGIYKKIGCYLGIAMHDFDTIEELKFNEVKVVNDSKRKASINLNPADDFIIIAPLAYEKLLNNKNKVPLILGDWVTEIDEKITKMNDMENPPKVIREFKKEYEHNPNKLNMLAYDGVTVALKVLLEVELPKYEEIKDRIISTVFNLETTGKIVLNMDRSAVKPKIIK